MATNQISSSAQPLPCFPPRSHGHCPFFLVRTTTVHFSSSFARSLAVFPHATSQAFRIPHHISAVPVRTKHMAHVRLVWAIALRTMLRPFSGHVDTTRGGVRLVWAMTVRLKCHIYNSARGEPLLQTVPFRRKNS